MPKRNGSMPFPKYRAGAAEKSVAEATAALEAFSQKARVTAARVVIHEGEAYAFKARIPTVDPRDFRGSIEASLEENVPIPIDDAVFEYDVMAVDAVRGQTAVSVSVVSKKTVSEYISLFGAAGIDVVSLETEARALARALFRPGEKGIRAVLDVKPRHSTVFVAEDGFVTFSSSIEVGAKDLETAVGKTFGVDAAAARALIDEKGFGPDADPAIIDAMIPVLSTIRDELAKVITFSKSQAKKGEAAGEVSEVVLAGETALVTGVDSYISATSKLPVRVGSVWTNVPALEGEVPSLPRRESLDYAALIGALI